MKELIYLGLGSNLGEPFRHLEEAIRQIKTGLGIPLQVSGIYESEAWGYSSRNHFFNCCLTLRTRLEPLRVLDMLLDIERGMGRERSAELAGGNGYADRIIDIDLLFYGDLCFEHPRLRIPHPAIAERRFVLMPLNEIAPGLIHPVAGVSVSQMLSACKDPGKVWLRPS
jgi:2-amino-4-hydroxy-6-hydroxymethyldihydropteridine diphosphokinase